MSGVALGGREGVGVGVGIGDVDEPLKGHKLICLRRVETDRVSVLSRGVGRILLPNEPLDAVEKHDFFDKVRN